MYDYSAQDEMHEFLKSCVELPSLGYWDYDWNELYAYYDPASGKFYWADASGCSCDGFWDQIRSLGDFHVGTKQQYLKSAQEYASEHGGDINTVRAAVLRLGKK